MTKARHTVRLPNDLSVQLVEFAARKRVHKSTIMQAAIESFLSPDNPERMEAAFTRRLDSMNRKVERLERDIEIGNEALALFIHFWLTTTPALPVDQMDAARASGRKRYSDFVTALGNRVGSRHSLAGDMEQTLGDQSQERS